MARSAILLVAATLALAGCASTAPAADDGTVKIVASTNVYGSIAEAIGGDSVTVTSLITTAAQDPHSFEASVRDQLTLSKADLVIENGGGYDPFIDTLLDAAGTDPVVITASEASGLLDPDHGHDESESESGEGDDHAVEIEKDGHDHIEGFNEHVWYSLHGVVHVAEAIASELTTLDPANAEAYADNLATFSGEISGLEASAAEITGGDAAITEPVPLYLLEAANFTNVTPDAFSEAIEEGTDVAPATLRDTLALFADGGVQVLAYNSQTASPETEEVRAAAEAAGVPVVEFTETLPDGSDYVSWMTDNIEALAAIAR